MRSNPVSKGSKDLLTPTSCNLVKQVRTPPVRPADGVVGCVYESFVLGVLSWCGAAGEDKVCGAHSRSVKCIALLSSTGSSPFKVGDNQRPEWTMSGVRKPSPESSVPGETLTGGRRRNQFCRGYGSPSVLNEVSHEFSTAMRFEKCKRSP